MLAMRDHREQTRGPTCSAYSSQRLRTEVFVDVGHSRLDLIRHRAGRVGEMMGHHALAPLEQPSDLLQRDVIGCVVDPLLGSLQTRIGTRSETAVRVEEHERAGRDGHHRLVEAPLAMDLSSGTIVAGDVVGNRRSVDAHGVLRQHTACFARRRRATGGGGHHPQLVVETGIEGTEISAGIARRVEIHRALAVDRVLFTEGMHPDHAESMAASIRGRSDQPPKQPELQEVPDVALVRFLHIAVSARPPRSEARTDENTRANVSRTPRVQSSSGTCRLHDVDRTSAQFVKQLAAAQTDSREVVRATRPGATLAAVNTRTIVKQVLALGDRVMKPADGVTVLIYHRVGGGSGSEVDLDVGAFRSQLEHLRAHHTVIDLDSAAAMLAGGRTGDGSVVPTRAVVVTFDDGTDDFCDVVVPALVEYGIAATLYAATHFVDSGEGFPWGASPASWAGLRDAASTGLVTIGSHTHTHALLDRADPADVGVELDRSIELIGDHIGTAPAHFAYPKALPGSEAAEAEVRRRFTTAALARSRVNEPGATDLHRLWRTPIQRSDDFDFFAAKAAGGLRLEGELRDLVARVKYRGATR